jgi:cell division septation protein DedD
MSSNHFQAVLGEYPETEQATMPTNEEGEFELVLGNKQLLSVFFLIVLLLGVFFSMGYIVGRNTAPGSSQLAAVRPGANTMVVESPAATAAPPPAAVPETNKPSPVSQPAPTAPPPPPPVETARVKPETPKPAEAVKTAPAKAEPAVEAPKPPVAGLSQPIQKGNYYLQVAAVREKDAAMLKDVLGKRGFSTATEEVPEKALVRVLVGPFRDQAAMNEAKEKLADFKPISRKL